MLCGMAEQCLPLTSIDMPLLADVVVAFAAIFHFKGQVLTGSVWAMGERLETTVPVVLDLGVRSGGE